MTWGWRLGWEREDGKGRKIFPSGREIRGKRRECMRREDGSVRERWERSRTEASSSTEGRRGSDELLSSEGVEGFLLSEKLRRDCAQEPRSREEVFLLPGNVLAAAFHPISCRRSSLSPFADSPSLCFFSPDSFCHPFSSSSTSSLPSLSQPSSTPLLPPLPRRPPTNSLPSPSTPRRPPPPPPLPPVAQPPKRKKLQQLKPSSRPSPTFPPSTRCCTRLGPNGSRRQIEDWKRSGGRGSREGWRECGSFGWWVGGF